MIITRTMPSTLAERKELLRTIARFPGRRVLVVGDLMLDQYIRGNVNRIFSDFWSSFRMIKSSLFDTQGKYP